MKRTFISTAIFLLFGAITGTYAQTVNPAGRPGTTPHVLERILKVKTIAGGGVTEGHAQNPVAFQTVLEKENIKGLFPDVLVDRVHLVASGKNSLKSISTQTIDPARLIPYLIQAIQEQQREIESLKAILSSGRGSTTSAK